MSLLRFKRSDVWYTLLLVGVAAALASFVAAVLALKVMYPSGSWLRWWTSIPQDLTAFPLIASLASAILGPALWWWTIIKSGSLNVSRGIAAGVLTATIAHPIVWYVALVLAFLRGQQAVASILVTNPLLDLLTAMVLAVISVICVGWLTALIGGVVGGVTARLQSIYGCQARWQAALSG